MIQMVFPAISLWLYQLAAQVWWYLLVPGRYPDRMLPPLAAPCVRITRPATEAEIDQPHALCLNRVCVDRSMMLGNGCTFFSRCFAYYIPRLNSLLAGLSVHKQILANIPGIISVYSLHAHIS